MPETRVAAQLYTLREFTKTPKDIARTFERLSTDGWRAVQCSALGPIEPRELKKLLDENGLTCCATHDGLAKYQNEPQQVIDYNRTLGCAYTALGAFVPKPDAPARKSWQSFVADFNAVAKQFEGSGVRLGYHNHSHEWQKAGLELDSPRPIDLLLNGLDESIWFEIDTYWVAHAGGDPAAWIDKVAGRIPCVHLKDMGIRAKNEQFMMEVGEGNLNWPAVLAACGRAGVEWYIVEQDTCYRDPFESLRTSLENLLQMGVE